MTGIFIFIVTKCSIPPLGKNKPFTKKQIFKKVAMNGLYTEACSTQAAGLEGSCSPVTSASAYCHPKSFSNRINHYNTCRCVKCHLRFLDFQMKSVVYSVALGWATKNHTHPQGFALTSWIQKMYCEREKPYKLSKHNQW